MKKVISKEGLVCLNWVSQRAEPFPLYYVSWGWGMQRFPLNSQILVEVLCNLALRCWEGRQREYCSPHAVIRSLWGFQTTLFPRDGDSESFFHGVSNPIPNSTGFGHSHRCRPSPQGLQSTLFPKGVQALNLSTA